MHDVDTYRPRPPAEPSAPLRHLLLRTALIVLVLGVLPVALDTDPMWQLLGVLVSAVMVARGAQLVWRAAFSTHPRHLPRR